MKGRTYANFGGTFERLLQGYDLGRNADRCIRDTNKESAKNI